MSTRQAEPDGAARASPSAPGTERRRIAAGNLSAPSRRPGIVDRPALVDALLSATHLPVVLVSAPAGYGKTTLLGLWRESDGRPFAWVSLDAAHNDPVALVADIVTALAPILDEGGESIDELRVPAAPLEEFVLPSLVEACIESGQAFVLVLDDLHVVRERRSQAAIRYLAEGLPVGCQLALATRTDPPLPLATWRAHRRLAELRAGDLSLRDTEAQALLTAAGVRLTDARVARLVQRTEGWPAAIYLAALSLRGHSDPEGFVDRFAGTTRHVADFLSEDVLSRQPEPVVDFLLHTCVLEELTASLCDALTEDAGGAAMLPELERSNLFVVPLDEEGHAYRYHHLFAQYLRAELARREPDGVADLHRRAWQWYRRHGLAGRAVRHAQAAGDIEVAGELVAAEWSALVRRGRVETVRRWLAGFDDAQIEGHAPLAIAAAWTAALTGERERAARFAEAARRGSWDGPMPDGAASLESALALMSAAFCLDGLSRMCSLGERAAELETRNSQNRAVALEVFGSALTLQGEFARAREVLAEAIRLGGEESSPGTFSLAHLAVISLREGDDESALAHAERAHAAIQRARLREHLSSVGPYSVLAHLLNRRGDLPGAAAALDRANALLPRLTEGFWWLMIETRILLAPVLAALGRGDEAAARLAEADALLAEHPDAGLLPEWHREAVRTLPISGRGGPSQELSDAERRILPLLASDLTLREIGRELYLSANTVKTHTRSIYRKLGVSSRAEAVSAARARARPRDSPG